MTLRRNQIIVIACLAAALVLGFISPLFTPPKIAGDGMEYFMMLQSLVDHRTPDLRPADITATNLALLEKAPYLKEIDPHRGFRLAGNGRWYCIHFWLYPLLALPVRVALQLAGGSGFAAFLVTNVILFVLTITLVFRFGGGTRSRRLIFLALAAIGPVIGFISWPHPELFTWCCAVTSLTLLERRHYGWAAAAAALGSAQNPPLVILALLPLAVAIARREGRQVLHAGLGLLPALFTPLFFLHHFAVPSLITHGGSARFSLISLSRTWSLLTDPNQGMLVHIPLLLLLGMSGALLALVRRRWESIGLTTVFLLIFLLVQTATNWNNDTQGIMRYAVWMIPLLAWLAADNISFKHRGAMVLLAVGLLLQTALLTTPQSRGHFLEPSPVARWALDQFPTMVHPEPEIFTERQTGLDGKWRNRLPVGFVGSDGSLLKILVTRQSLDRLLERMGMEGEPVAALIHSPGRPNQDLLYLHPPRGRINVVEPIGWGQQALDSRISWRPINLPGALLSPRLRFDLEITNSASYRFWGSSSGARHPLDFYCCILEDGRKAIRPSIETPFTLGPGETVTLPVVIELPRRRGTISIELVAGLRGLATSEVPARITIEILTADERSFLARLDSHLR